MVFNDVIVHPPYKIENVEMITHGKTHGKDLEYVRKLVLNRQEQNNNSSSSGASSASAV